MKKPIVLALALMAMTAGYASTAFCYGCYNSGSHCSTNRTCRGRGCVCIKAEYGYEGHCMSVSRRNL